MAKVEKVLKGETYPRGIEVIDLEGRRFKVSHVTRLKDGDAWLEHEANLSQMAEEDLLKHALADIIIKYRSRSFKRWTLKEVQQKFASGFVFKPEDYPAQKGGGKQTAESRVQGGIRAIGKESRTKKEAIARMMVMLNVDRKVAEQVVEANLPELK